MRGWMPMVLAALIGVSAQAQAVQSPAPRGVNQRTTETAKLRDEWARNLHDKRIDASVAEYAPDAEFIDPSGGRVVGADAIRNLFKTITATYDSDLKFSSQRVRSSGNLAYDSGTYAETLMVRATGKAQHASGSYLTIYRREKNGAWLIVEQVWTGATQ